MATVQISSFLPQLIRLKKVEELSMDLRSMMKTLSLKEAEAVGNAFEVNALKTKEEKMDPWM